MLRLNQTASQAPSRTDLVQRATDELYDLIGFRHDEEYIVRDILHKLVLDSLEGGPKHD